MRISDWSSDVCSSDLRTPFLDPSPAPQRRNETRSGLRVDRVKRENEVGNQAIALAACRMEGMRIARQRHVERTHTIWIAEREIGVPRQRLDMSEHLRVQ